MSEIRLRIKFTFVSCHEIEVMASHIDTSEAIASVTEVTYDNFDYATSLLFGKLLQTQIDRILSEAPVKCPHNSKYDSSASADEYILFSDAKNEHILLVSC